MPRRLADCPSSLLNPSIIHRGYVGPLTHQKVDLCRDQIPGAGVAASPCGLGHFCILVRGAGPSAAAPRPGRGRLGCVWYLLQEGGEQTGSMCRGPGDHPSPPQRACAGARRPPHPQPRAVLGPGDHPTPCPGQHVQEPGCAT